MLDLSSPSIEARVSKTVPSSALAAIRDICELSPEILACIVLDIRQRDFPEAPVSVLIDLTLTDRAQIESIASRFSGIISSNAKLTGRVYFASTGKFDSLLRYALYRATKCRLQ